MSDVPFINLEYIFVKIYDFLIYIKNVILTGSFYASSGGGSDFASTFSWLGSIIATLLVLIFFIALIFAIYIRVRVYEVDQQLDGQYKGHFIKPVQKEEQVNVRWSTISYHFSSANPNDWKAAIMEADIMLDELIQNLGYPGENLGERLKAIRIQDFPTLQSAWEAHKIRNKIAHEPSYHLSDREKELARKNFEHVFRSAGMI